MDIQKAIKYFDGYGSLYDDLVIKGLKAITVLESICEHCGYEVNSKECNECAIDTWRKGEGE